MFLFEYYVFVAKLFIIYVCFEDNAYRSSYKTIRISNVNLNIGTYNDNILFYGEII